jgi:hypothetical protein
MEGKITTFSGMMPIYDKRLLPPGYAQLIRDAELDSGNFKPLKEPQFTAELTDPYRRATYRYEDPAFEGGERWLSWRDGLVNVLKSPVSGDQFNRIYYIDPTSGIMKFRTGNNEYRVGIPKPKTPTVTTKQRPPDSWIRSWGYWLESKAGIKVGQGTMAEEGLLPADAGVRKFVPGTSSTTTGANPGQTDLARSVNWYLSNSNMTSGLTIPADHVFVPFFTAYTKKDKNGGYGESNRGIELGTLIPKLANATDDRSQNRGQSDFGINGVKLEASYVTSGDPNVFTISYSNVGATLTTSYVVTFINSFGEEGEPSDPTPLININPLRIARLANLDNGSDYAAMGYAPITKLRVYRVVTGNSTAIYKFVSDIELSTIPNATTGWDDVYFDVETAETLSTVGSGNPPDGMRGLVNVAGGFYAAFKGSSIYFSHPYYPYSWPGAYELSFPYKIKALGASGNTVAVLTDEHPFLVTGYEPATMVPSKMAIPFPCVNEYVTTWGGAIVYISNEGVIAINGATGLNLTEKFWSRTQWLALRPETMHMTTYKEKLYLFANLKSLETDQRDAESTSGFDSYVVYPTDERKAVNALSTYVQGLWNDLSRDALYVIRGTSVYRIEGAANPYEAKFISKETSFNNPTHPAALKVVAENYPVKVTFLSGNNYSMSITATDSKSRKLPKMRKDKYWAIQLDTRFVVRELATSMSIRGMSAQ